MAGDLPPVRAGLSQAVRTVSMVAFFTYRAANLPGGVLTSMSLQIRANRARLGTRFEVEHGPFACASVLA